MRDKDLLNALTVRAGNRAGQGADVACQRHIHCAFLQHCSDSLHAPADTAVTITAVTIRVRPPELRKGSVIAQSLGNPCAR
ncbi:hypothetical protein [Streptomyces sp. NPDC001404]|uniref:hypothetical protein n=1 Tax=Streptomyces sp. NPDC001404 TaxID=3364571 RepID=UPI0036975285